MFDPFRLRLGIPKADIFPLNICRRSTYLAQIRTRYSPKTPNDSKITPAKNEVRMTTVVQPATPMLPVRYL